MLEKIKKTVRLTPIERNRLDEFKNISGMTYSAIAEKSMLIFIKNKNKVNPNKHDARNNCFLGDKKTQKILFYLKKDAIIVINNYCMAQNCTLSDLFISAFDSFAELR